MNRWHQELLYQPLVINDFVQPYALADALPEPRKCSGGALAHRKETQGQGVEKTLNP